MAYRDDETEEPTRKTAKLEEENVEINIEHVITNIQATDTGQDKEFASYFSPNDVQGAIPRIPDDTETINDFILDNYLKDPSEPLHKLVTAGLLRATSASARQLYQDRVTCDLQTLLNKGIHEPWEPEKSALDRTRKIVEDDKNLPFVDEDFEGPFIGNRDIVEQVATRISLTLQKKKIQSQNSFAFVHTGASGVGKTFTAMCLAELLQNSMTFAGQDIRFVFVYIGFHAQMPLKIIEELLIERGTVKDHIISQGERIRRIVLSRLILVLMLMIKHNEIYEINYLHAQPMMPIDFESITPYDDCLKLLHELDSEILKEKVSSLCSELTKKIGKSTVIVINIDEGRFLDIIVSLQGKLQWARIALRVLREMQKSIFNDQNGTCLLLPIATGIRPATSLDDETEGQNIGVSSPVLNKADYRTIAEQIFPNLNEKKLSYLVEMMYPRVRELQNCGGKVFQLDSNEKCSYENLQKILVAGFGGARADRAIIPQLMATRDSVDSDGVPILDIGVWPWILRKLRASDRGTLLKLPIQLPLDVIGNGLDCYDFQRTAFDVLVFTLIFFSELEWGLSDVELLEYLDLSELFSIFNGNLGVSGPGTYTFIKATPEEATQSYLPFSVRGSHEEAYNSSLNELFVLVIKELKVGQSLLFSCGISGSAMLDYICVCKVAESTRRTKGRLVLRYGDAKHSATKQAVDDNQIKYLQKKTSEVHDAITKRAKKDFGFKKYIVSADYKLFIITNIHRTYEGFYVLSPETFKFEPWTTALFELPYSGTESGTENGAVLSSSSSES